MTKRKWSGLCVTTDSKMLTRACVINFDIDKVTYDRSVKPPSHITLTDSVTRCVDILCSPFRLNRQISFSGITAEALESITRTLSEVQAHLHTPIMSSTILLGRSLKSDPRALQHRHCMIFHYPLGRPLKRGLAWLACRWPGHTIQYRGPGGHDPEPKRMRVRSWINSKQKIEMVCSPFWQTKEGVE